MVLKNISSEQFYRFVESASKVSFLQTVEMADLLKKRGFDTRFLALEIEGQLEVAALLYSKSMTGGLHMEINAGPVSRSSQYLKEFYRELQMYAKKNSALQLVVKPYDTFQTFDSFGNPIDSEDRMALATLMDLGYAHDGLKTGYPGGEPDWLYVKDLTGLTTETLVSSFDKKGKSALKKARTFPLSLRPLQRDELHIFKDITSLTADRQDFVDKSLEYYQALYDSFGEKAEFMLASLNVGVYKSQLDEQLTLFVEQIERLESEGSINSLSYTKNNQLKNLKKQVDSLMNRQKEAQTLLNRFGYGEIAVAASLFVYSSHEVVYLFSGSYKELNRFYAPALLQEYAMKQAIEKNISFYNFLGITGCFDGSDGVLRFKQGFNGFIIRKMGTFRYYPKPIKAQILQLIKKVLGR